MEVRFFQSNRILKITWNVCKLKGLNESLLGDLRGVIRWRIF